MKISSIEVHDYRAFQDPFRLKLGSAVTAISGLNGIGKSTLLAILANSSELKPADGKLLNGDRFRGDFSDVIMYDGDNDTTGDKAVIKFVDVPQTITNNANILNVTYRATIQDHSIKKVTFKKNPDGTFNKHERQIQAKRYRLIPKREKGGWETSSKVTWPTYYMGLSRIYPLGEAASASLKKIDPRISKEIVKWHKKILAERFSIEDTSLEGISIGNLFKDKTGVSTDDYGAKANSSGQDNIGQILQVIFSFRELKNKLGTDYSGGLLAIDEIEATLHPAAQNALFDYLLQSAKQLNLQIVFTTHSITLLEHISKSMQKPANRGNTLKIAYLHVNSDKPGQVLERPNPTSDYFRNNLSQTYTLSSRFATNIQVLLEDDRARWFFNLIIKNSQLTYLEKLKVIPNVSISWSHIVELKAAAADQLRNIIVILDPDLNSDPELHKLDRLIQKTMLPDNPNDPSGSLFTLPGNQSIEKMLAIFLETLPGSDPFFESSEVADRGMSYDQFKSQTPKILFGDNEKTMYKNWFQKFHIFMEPLAKRWITDESNAKSVDTFCQNLNQATHRLNSLLSKD